MLLWLCGTLQASSAATEQDSGFRVLRAALTRQDERTVLNADTSYHFSDTALDALRNGVPLTVVMKLKVVRERPSGMDRTVLDTRIPFHVHYHPLAKQYQLEVGLERDSRRNFAGFNSLLDAMSTIRNLPVGAPAALGEPGRYRAKLALSLDIEALPLPLRPVAYFSPAWYLDSPWHRWSFVVD